MKKLIATLAIAITMSTAASADSVCDKVAEYGAYTGVAVGVGATVMTIAAMPVVGTGVAAGTTIGYASMWASPFLFGTTLPTLAIGGTINGAMYGVIGYMAGVVGCDITRK